MTDQKLIKLIHIAQDPWEKRWEPAQEFLKKENIDLQVSYSKCNEADVRAHFDNAKKEMPDILVIDEKLALPVFKFVTHTTQNSDLFGASLLFLKKNDTLWPSALYEEAIVKSISKNIKELDLMAPALVAGAGSETRFVVPALARIGFNRISISDQNPELGEKLVAEFQKKLFNVEFRFVKFETITTLPGVYSLVINSTPLNLENQVLEELYFFNFLKVHGAVIDLSLVPPLTPLLTEAEEWGARLLSGDTIAALYDSLIFKEVTGVRFPEEEYSSRLREAATSVPFDLQPYLQRFLDRI